MHTFQLSVHLQLNSAVIHSVTIPEKTLTSQYTHLQGESAGQSAVVARMLQREGLLKGHVFILGQSIKSKVQFSKTFVLDRVKQLTRDTTDTTYSV